MTSPAAQQFARKVLLPAAFVLILGGSFAVFAPSLFNTSSYAVYVDGDIAPESREALSEVLANRVRLFPRHFRLNRATLAVSEDGTHFVVVRSRNEPSEFIASLLNPNVIELREARRADEGDRTPEGFSDAILPVPEYDILKIPRRKIREEPIFLSQSPGMVLQKPQSVRMWTNKKISLDPVISLEFAEEDAPRFAQLTGRLAQGPEGTMLALLIDGKVTTAGIVDARIEGGSVDLRDVATKEDAALIAAMIEAGPLPDGVKLRAEKQEPAD